jgi:UDP:flavonoid glycosyltransferase YjiC (YdhE family)
MLSGKSSNPESSAEGGVRFPDETAWAPRLRLVGRRDWAMKRILVFSTGGAGGDLQPLIAVTLGLRARGHEVHVVGDAALAKVFAQAELGATVLPSAHDFEPRYQAGVRAAQGRDPATQGGIMLGMFEDWSQDVATPVRELVREHRADLLVTSLFGARAAESAGSGAPWAVVNSTFYVGPDPPRPRELDFAPRSVPLFANFAAILNGAPLVLHATDQEFDYGHLAMPPQHHYVGPLLWEPPGHIPKYLEEPGPRWILVTLSSLRQDDLSIARAALDALADQPWRVLVTTGGNGPQDLGLVPANGRVEQYASHAAVLEVGDLLIGPAGHGAVMKSLWFGVPMVLVPWGRDQPGVAARATHAGAALALERDEFSPERLASAVDAILAEPSYRQAARAMRSRLRASDSVLRACELLEGL